MTATYNASGVPLCDEETSSSDIKTVYSGERNQQQLSGKQVVRGLVAVAVLFALTQGFSARLSLAAERDEASLAQSGDYGASSTNTCLGPWLNYERYLVNSFLSTGYMKKMIRLTMCDRNIQDTPFKKAMWWQEDATRISANRSAWLDDEKDRDMMNCMLSGTDIDLEKLCPRGQKVLQKCFRSLNILNWKAAASKYIRHCKIMNGIKTSLMTTTENPGFLTQLDLFWWSFAVGRDYKNDSPPDSFSAEKPKVHYQKLFGTHHRTMRRVNGVCERKDLDARAFEFLSSNHKLLLEQADTNKDGLISKDEFPRYVYAARFLERSQGERSIKISEFLGFAAGHVGIDSQFLTNARRLVYPVLKTLLSKEEWQTRVIQIETYVEKAPLFVFDAFYSVVPGVNLDNVDVMTYPAVLEDWSAKDQVALKELLETSQVSDISQGGRGPCSGVSIDSKTWLLLDEYSSIDDFFEESDLFDLKKKCDNEFFGKVAALIKSATFGPRSRVEWIKRDW